MRQIWLCGVEPSRHGTAKRKPRSCWRPDNLRKPSRERHADTSMQNATAGVAFVRHILDQQKQIGDPF